jgi:predicted GNAT superfamily acetyltransferase
MDWSAESQGGRSSSASGIELEQVGGASSNDIPLEIRRLTTTEDFVRAVELQRITWGETFHEVVPAAVLKISQRVGGITAGAFRPSGEMVGFVYGLTGFCDSRLAHWSHMLAVQPEHRDRGIGRRLKEYQRELLVAAGIEWMYWTFDPLVARNAHLNVNRLCAAVREYVPEMYGDTGSGLHAFGTDRFIMAWSLNGNARARVMPVLDADLPLNDLTERQLSAVLTSMRPSTVCIEIPPDVEQISVSDARAWRASTRQAFLAALHADYEVSGFRGAPSGRCFYVLSTAAAQPA